jgi:hypothetical protein
MPHEPTEGKGVLFPQRDKKHPKAPDLKGQIMINGEVVKLSAWTKKSQYGEFFSLAVDNWMAKPAKQYPKDVTPDGGDVPF